MIQKCDQAHYDTNLRLQYFKSVNEYWYRDVRENIL